MNEAKTKKKLAAKNRSHSLGEECSKSITKKIERYLTSLSLHLRLSH